MEDLSRDTCLLLIIHEYRLIEQEPNRIGIFGPSRYYITIYLRTISRKIKSIYPENKSKPKYDVVKSKL